MVTSPSWCPMLADNVAIRKHMEYNEKKGRFQGYIDLGSGESTDNASLATEAFFIMEVTLNGDWKLPLGYFLVSFPQERANLVKIAMEKVHDIGGWIISLTCDGPCSNISMLHTLVAKLSSSHSSPYFTHPSDSTKRVHHVFLDIVHILKLVCNCLGNVKELVSPEGTIKW